MIVEYLESLLQEIDYRKDKLSKIETIYIGGGTPSILSPSQFHTLFQSLASHVDLDKVLEFTVEANPNDIDIDKLMAFQKGHVTRISLGVQTFNDRHLESIGRNHTANDVFQAIKMIRSVSGFDINLDLIYGLPGQKPGEVIHDLEEVARLKPDHVSYYQLILEERTRFYHDYIQGKISFPDEEEIFMMSENVKSGLGDAGYRRYEISNYSRSGKESRHNLSCWQLEEYLGVGMASASQYDNSRFVNMHTLQQYIRKLKSEHDATERIEPFEPEIEMLMLGLRMTAGISTSDYAKRFGKSVFQRFPALKKHIGEGLLIVERERLYLSDKGLDLANYVLSDLF